MIIAYLGRNVKDYRKNSLRYLEKLKFICPVCGSNTVFHDCYDRHIHIDEKIEWIVIQRVICVGCDKTHAVLPDFIRPYKHYCAAGIELTIRDIEDGVPMEQADTAASISTVKRWVGEFKNRSCQAVGALRALLHNVFDKTINEIKLTGFRIFNALEYILDTLPTIESNCLAIGDANIWLTHRMAGIYI
ncbi:MAG: DUF6431 domain-containing protein [Clostridia bacterium]|nr:DUF6431 domain-containing protein [Clostridia bacterium]